MINEWTWNPISNNCSSTRQTSFSYTLFPSSADPSPSPPHPPLLAWMQTPQLLRRSPPLMGKDVFILFLPPQHRYYSSYLVHKPSVKFLFSLLFHLFLRLLSGKGTVLGLRSKFVPFGYRDGFQFIPLLNTLKFECSKRPCNKRTYLHDKHHICRILATF